jgi:hypothetical protein
MKMEVICSFETLVDFHKTTQRYIPEDRTHHNRYCENLKSYISLFGPSCLLKVWHGKYQVVNFFLSFSLKIIFFNKRSHSVLCEYKNQVMTVLFHSEEFWEGLMIMWNTLLTIVCYQWQWKVVGSISIFHFYYTNRSNSLDSKRPNISHK